MADLTKNYIKWISDFLEPQFDEVVEEYIKSIWKIDDLVITDGTNDGGNDIRIFEDNKKLKVQIQVTIQESNIDGKIRKELNNAKSNVERFAYQNSLYFFYSHPLSEDKVNDFEIIAERDFDINLQIIDAKRIAAGAKRFEALSEAIRRQYGIVDTNQKALTEEDRIFYDFISFGSNTAEIKGQIIDSFIVNKVYEYGKLQKTAIIEQCSKHFGNSESAFLNRAINRLKQSQKLLENENKKDFYFLSPEENERINGLKQQFNFYEQKLINDIKELLEKFNIDTDRTQQIIEKLKELFESNFNIDKKEILDKAYELDEDENVKNLLKFYRFIRSLLQSVNSAKLLTKRLLETCSENDILQKLSAGKLFSSFAHPDVIRNYIDQSERLVFLDTQIVLHALCYYYDQVNYPNQYYLAVKDLIELNKKYKGLSLQFYYKYLNEVAYHLKEAILLIPFEESGLLDGLGGTNNVFFNFYLFLKKEGLLEEDVDNFGKFLFYGFDLKESDAFHYNYFSIAEGILRERLSSLNISIYDTQYEGDYVEEAKRAIRYCLSQKERTRPEPTVNNDSNMLSILFDEKVSINEPVFISWDHRLFCARKEFYEVYRGARMWHWFTPTKFTTHISLLNFNIDSSTITRDIISVFEDNFDFYKRTKDLLDSLAKFLSVRGETGRKYLQKIKEFKREYVFEVDKKYKNVDNEIELVEERTYPIVEIIVNLTKHYTFEKPNNYDIEQFKMLFSRPEFFDKVVNFFKEQINYYMKYKRQNDLIYNKMNELIKQALANQTEENQVKKS